MPSIDPIYSTPPVHSFRFPLNKPKWKSNPEAVLFRISESICKLPDAPTKEFSNSLRELISEYPEIPTGDDKTIDNWKTEIPTGFGLTQIKDNISTASKLSLMLAENQDLVSFFKCYVTKFQFPNGINKEYKTCEIIRAGIKFKPAELFLNAIKQLIKNNKEAGYLTKNEATFVLLNDKRFTQPNPDLKHASSIIIQNRLQKSLKYKSFEGDNRSLSESTRIAGDILDYMVLANLLVKKGNKYLLNSFEDAFINAFLQHQDFFKDYDDLYNKDDLKPSDLKGMRAQWFDHVNNLDVLDYKTDIGAFIRSHSDNDEVDFTVEYDTIETLTTKEIGDSGEKIIISHERAKLKREGADSLLHLVKFMPTHQAHGYDVQSRGLDESFKYIEVKTTISNKKFTQSRFHLTKNEWNCARSNRDKYYVYRLVISTDERKLFIIKDPVGAYKKDLIDILAPDGLDIIYSEKSGENEELLA